MLEILVLVRGRTGFTVSVVEVLLVTRLAVLGAYTKERQKEDLRMSTGRGTSMPS